MQVRWMASVTQTGWWLVGALVLGLFIVVFFLLFCPEECLWAKAQSS